MGTDSNSLFTNTGFEPQDGSGFVENYTQTHSYTNFEPQDGSDFVENYTNTHSYSAFEPQDGSGFVENISKRILMLLLSRKREQILLRTIAQRIPTL